MYISAAANSLPHLMILNCQTDSESVLFSNIGEQRNMMVMHSVSSQDLGYTRTAHWSLVPALSSTDAFTIGTLVRM